MKQLRHMSAKIENVESLELVLSTGEIVPLENPIVLHSYNSRVAVYANNRVYLLPRYDYSPTTWKHVHAFIQDYCKACNDYCAYDIRKIAELGVCDDEQEYCFASGIVVYSPEYNNHRHVWVYSPKTVRY